MYRKYIILLSLSVVAFGFTLPLKTSEWKPLFNGKNFSGWDIYLGPDLDDKGNAITKIPLGLNNDPRHVFTIVKEDNESIIWVSGENWGAIITKSEYENYHLQLQFKWGKLQWGQKKSGHKDSGLLYHSVGKYGADYGAWMRAQEFQIEEGNCGDFWGCAGGTADIPAIKRSESDYIYSPQGELLTFSEGNKQGRHCTKQGVSAENPAGKWNTLDLYCHGDTSIHVVNGKVAMVLYHNSQADNGKLSPLNKGKIQLQSEGAEIFYRHIKMQSISQLPAELIKQ
ncbi:DUF1080 domain-containing protein [Mucilaginibacter corticis]|uniref:DUF1080 domain-containing protein n=1 Tax=Mucilaginibacter corticis TaxID=2597670 RepID=A0A556MHB4_9SPHI|nr:DUF1080 domain-containing protein [Mucilaginibacter corticis]TSJ39215.1 DUF1080 domain-containing protein [Mucilaginibacter corticis]